MHIKPANIDKITTNTIKSSLATTSFTESIASNPSISFTTESLAVQTFIDKYHLNSTEQFFKELEEAKIQQFKKMEENRILKRQKILQLDAEQKA